MASSTGSVTARRSSRAGSSGTSRCAHLINRHASHGRPLDLAHVLDLGQQHLGLGVVLAPALEGAQGRGFCEAAFRHVLVG